MELKPIVKEWLALLRSGSIKQGRGKLARTDGTRCCLGVACDLAADKGIIEAGQVVPLIAALQYGSEATSNYLPISVQLAFGIKTNTAVINGDKYNAEDSLAIRNDRGDTFTDIADAIEQYADKLFMNPVEELIARLRSGTVQQGQGYLGYVSNGKRCCLGVACDIAVEHGIIPPPKPQDNDTLLYGYGPSASDTSLPKEVCDFFGFSGSEGGFTSPEDGSGNSLIHLNDIRCNTFTEIADVIESRPKALFIENDPYAAQ